MDDIEKRTKEREKALRAAVARQRRLATPQDYLFDKSQEKFWDLQDGTLNGKLAVDASIPLELWRVEVEEGDPPAEEGAPKKRGRPKKRKERLIEPSRDIMRVENDQFVEGSTWWPGQPQIVEDWFIDAQGFRPAPGRRIYNAYLPPPEARSLGGDPAMASMWVEHVRSLWPDPQEHEYFFDYCAHMVQRPDEKANAAIILSGLQGIGKDAALLPVKMAIGIWNSTGVSPDDLFSQYRPWLETLMLVVDEVRPTDNDHQASSMYNILKPLTAAPPMTLPLNDKFEKVRHVINLMRVILTTNDWMSMYIPAEDRRMFIMHSMAAQGWHVPIHGEDYFDRLFGWFDDRGYAHVAAWLAERDISAFNPKQAPPKTTGWKAVAGSWAMDNNDDAISAALDTLGKPSIVFGPELADASMEERDVVVGLLRSSRKIGLRMQRSGYMLVEPPKGQDRWSFPRTDGRNPYRSRTVFVRPELFNQLGQDGLREAIEERGRALAAGGKPTPLVVVQNKSSQG